MSPEVQTIIASVPASRLEADEIGNVIGRVNANTIIHTLKQGGFVIVPVARLRRAVHEVMEVLADHETDTE